MANKKPKPHAGDVGRASNGTSGQSHSTTNEQEPQPRRLADVLAVDNGENVKVRDIVGKELVILATRSGVGPFGDYIRVVAELDGERVNFFTSHTVLMGQFAQVKETDLPAAATIYKRQGTKRWYYAVK